MRSVSSVLKRPKYREKPSANLRLVNCHNSHLYYLWPEQQFWIKTEYKICSRLWSGTIESLPFIFCFCTSFNSFLFHFATLPITFSASWILLLLANHLGDSGSIRRQGKDKRDMPPTKNIRVAGLVDSLLVWPFLAGGAVLEPN